MASDPPLALSIENLDNELASVIRVRKRLSESTVRPKYENYK